MSTFKTLVTIAFSAILISSCSQDSDKLNKYLGNWGMYDHDFLHKIKIKTVNEDIIVYDAEVPHVAKFIDGKIVIDRGDGVTQSLIYSEDSDKLIVERRGEFQRR